MSRKASIIISAVLGIILALWLWTIIVPKNAMSIGGSTSVDPIMQRLTNEYRKKDDGDAFVYSSSGSRGGITNVESGTYKMGFISKEIDDSLKEKLVVNNEYKFNENVFDTNNLNDNKTSGDKIFDYLKSEKSKEGDKMNYIEIAQDAIIIIYTAPEQWKDEHYSELLNLDPKNETSREVMNLIYTGKEDPKNPKGKNLKATWGDIIKILKPDDNKHEDWMDALITPFARETGSGTRNSFEDAFGIGQEENKKPSIATEYNSNGMLFTSLAKENSFGYVSMSYLNAIKEEQKNNETKPDERHLNVVKIDGIDPTDDNFNPSAYQLSRPYIGLFKANLKDKDLRKIADFIAWMYLANGTVPGTTSDTTAGEQYKHEGLVPEFKLNWKL